MIFFLFVLMSCASSRKPNAVMQPLTIAPFVGLDTLATNDWWNRGTSPIINIKVDRDSVVAFGLYTISDNILKLSAQLFPLYPEETRVIRLELYRNGRWQQVQQQNVNDLGWSALFRIESWDDRLDVPYRLRHGMHASFEGLIRRNPREKDIVSIAALSCNSNQDRGDRIEYVRNINHQDPDLIFFAGDQSYDHTEHTAAWLKWGMQFRDIFRQRPCVTIPDDHDIGQGNIWGESGKIASSSAGHDGGYFYHHEYVKMVERCQTAHLPDPYDPAPIGQGIGVYFSRLLWGNVDFAIIEDRKFKSGPSGKIPQQGPRPDHIRNPDYDPASIDVEGLVLLGQRQLDFLKDWSSQQDGISFKVVLSQTGFCGGAHIHGSLDNRLHADLDSNGWPQTGRNNALRLIKAANAIHIGGDQHIPTVIHHGIDNFEDGPWAFVVPAIVNNYYSRWWWPEDDKGGDASNGKLPWNGRYLDGFGNKITMHAYANPDSKSSAAGYGLIRFDRTLDQVIFECWPRYADVSKTSEEQFLGWPVVVPMNRP